MQYRQRVQWGVGSVGGPVCSSLLWADSQWWWNARGWDMYTLVRGLVHFIGLAKGFGLVNGFIPVLFLSLLYIALGNGPVIGSLIGSLPLDPCHWITHGRPVTECLCTSSTWVSGCQRLQVSGLRVSEMLKYGWMCWPQEWTKGHCCALSCCQRMPYMVVGLSVALALSSFCGLVHGFGLVSGVGLTLVPPSVCYTQSRAPHMRP